MWHARPLFDDDIPEVVAMVNACELADSGEVMLEAADLVADLTYADRERDATVVMQNGRIVGWAMVWDQRKRWADVHPDARGQGIGTWLLRWAAWRASQLGAGRTGQTIDDRRTEVARFFQAHGYSPRYTSWVLTIPAAPGTHTAEPASPARTDEVLTLFETAFGEHADRQAVSLEQWRAGTVDRRGFQPEDLLVVRQDGRLAAAAFLVEADEIWVDKLAVAARFRGQGLARELLTAARARAWARGYPQVRLSTDSNTSALAVYERLGMRIERSFTHWAVDL
ncbi:MAG TPA: GNAT family N-acetyltransferase [Actinomycetota bacterium]|nr:GNAT family N-acetyltransferase [Actinomycetota bacterium]